MTFSSAVALFGVMLVLAAVPTTSVMIVVSRSTTSGFIHGFLAALGIVTGDIVFILIAILGLSYLADSFTDLFVIVKYLGGAYLLWVGLKLWRLGLIDVKVDETVETSLLTSFTSGLLFTLADQKAILFYLGFFPAFVDLSALTILDTCVILIITLFTVGGVKVAYAYTAAHAVLILSSTTRRRLNIIAGSLMIAIALFVVIGA